MIDYLQTTSLILLMVFAQSVISTAIFTLLAIKRPVSQVTREGLSWPIPALIAAPTFIALVYWFSDANVMFPSLFEAGIATVLLYTFIPGLVLLLASGMLGSIWRFSFDEAARWKLSPFFQFSKAMGLPEQWTLGKLIFASVLVRSWTTALPWVFGELIVVEAMFNAPGLGLDIWHFAKIQDSAAFTKALAWLVGLYALCFLVTRIVSLRIGERLKSYA